MNEYEIRNSSIDQIVQPMKTEETSGSSNNWIVQDIQVVGFPSFCLSGLRSPELHSLLFQKFTMIYGSSISPLWLSYHGSSPSPIQRSLKSNQYLVSSFCVFSAAKMQSLYNFSPQFNSRSPHNEQY